MRLRPGLREVEVFSKICEHEPMTKQLFDRATGGEGHPLFGPGLTGADELTKNRERRGNVDITRGEMVESELDTLIKRRHVQRVRDEGARRAHEAWDASVQRYNTNREEVRRQERAAYHRAHADRLRRVLGDLVAHHQREAEKLDMGGAA